ncbi:MAG: AAA family ATPase, partial [Anaerolineae bacterium]|nr:AAA family ATPase [Anaerolineae bacterium]
MSDLLHTIAAYVPQSLTRAVLSDPSPAPPTKPQTKRMQAAVLFADVSGFTPLTEALGQKGSEGPEELTRILNTYFSWMIAFVEGEGGEVVKFGGDALTVVFLADEEPLGVATRRALQAAETMRGAMEEFRIVESSVGLVALKMKFGIGAGEVLTTQVGGLFNRWEYTIAGDALRQATQAENRAEQGDIVLSPEAESSITRQRLSPRPLPELDWDSVQDPAAVISVLRHYIPGPVRTWLDGKLHDWLATLRPMSVMFAGIKGLDYSQPGTVDELHEILGEVQKIIYNYWGAFTRLTVDDKGTVLLVLFGAPPYSHEDDPERALRCALDLQVLAKNCGLKLATGVTAGRVFAGPVGGDTRREYTVMGDAVNLAARLMVAAGPGRICCNYEAYRSTYDKIKFEPLPPMEIKGKAGFIPIYRALEYYQPLQLAKIKRGEANDRLIGRQAEVERLVTCLEKARSGDSSIVVIEGEAGIGKSRLVEKLVELTDDSAHTIVLGMGRSIEQATPYHAWKGILATYFGLDTTNGVVTKQVERQRQIQSRVRAVHPELEECLPLLNDVFTLNLPDNSFTASLKPSLRDQHLVALAAALVRSWADEKPLVIILEDAHWLDAASWKLAVQIAVASIKDQTPLMLVLVTRPLEDVNMRTDTTLLTALEETEYIRLDSLSTDETLALAARRMGLSRHELPEAVAELLHRRAGGNPFFAEELFYTLHESGSITFKTMGDRIRCLISGDLDRAAQTLPTTIQSVVLTRIDQLPPEKQLTLRIAAVIGQTFSHITLYDTLKKHSDIPQRLYSDYVDDLTYLDLIRPERPGPNATYEFRHVIIREVSYQSLLFE